jgi:hypothetical protein
VAFASLCGIAAIGRFRSGADISSGVQNRIYEYAPQFFFNEGEAPKASDALRSHTDPVDDRLDKRLWIFLRQVVLKPVLHGRELVGV